MKIAVISDIRSNIYALEAVLDDIKNRNVDVVLNLGDSFYGAIAPKESYNLIRKSSFINICGDKDREILEASLAQLEENNLLKYVYSDLGEEVLYFIQDLPFEKLIGEDFYMIHGTYFNDMDSLLECISNNKQREDSEIIKLTDDIKSNFIFCSNSNEAKVITLNTGQVVITPGNLGVSMDNEIVKDASYAILSIEENQYEVQLLKVNYDYMNALEKAKNSF